MAEYVFGLLGGDTSKSLSPRIHTLAMRKAGVRGTYLTYSAPEGELESAVRDLRGSSLSGFNVTIPFKEKIMGFLDAISTEAEKIGAVNTVKIYRDRLTGYNTDSIAFLRSLEDENFEPTGRNALVIGSGGAARAVCFGLSGSPVASLAVASRNTDRAKTIIDAGHFTQSGISCRAMSLSDLSMTEEIERADLIVNTTPVGSSRFPGASPLPAGAPIPRGQVVVDIVYEPPVTPLMVQAASAGAETANGLGMLVHQALESLKIWLGVDVDAGYVLSRL